jgi:hypothetical protein
MLPSPAHVVLDSDESTKTQLALQDLVLILVAFGHLASCTASAGRLWNTCQSRLRKSHDGYLPTRYGMFLNAKQCMLPVGRLLNVCGGRRKRESGSGRGSGSLRLDPLVASAVGRE